jgi:hypothetical protein
MLVLLLAAVPFNAALRAEEVSDGPSANAAKSRCDVNYDSLVSKARDALTRGDRKQTIDLLVRAQNLLKRCADLQEHEQAPSRSEAACRSPLMPPYGASVGSGPSS